MEYPLISVIIPVYNGEKFIERSINSVLAQTFNDYEIIVVDDGSTDSTDSIILNKFKDKVKYYKKINEGPGKAIEFGVNLSTGKYIAFLDQDDFWFPEKLEKQIYEFIKNPALAFVSTDYYQGSDPNCEKKSMLSRYKYFHKDPFEQLLLENPICAPSVLVKKNILLATGFSKADVSFGPWDRPLWVRIAYKYPYKIIREILMWKYLGESNLSLHKNYSYFSYLHWKESLLFFKDKCLSHHYYKLIKKNCAIALYKTSLYHFWNDDFMNFRRYLVKSSKYLFFYPITKPYTLFVFIPNIILYNLKKIKKALSNYK